MKDLDNNQQTIDWKKFGSIEVKRLSEDIRNNHSVLNELGAYIAFCEVDSEFDTTAIDQNFVKLFKCSQVLIEYLLSEYNRSKNSVNERKSYNTLIKENKKLRKLLEIQQKAMTYSRTFDGENVQCPHCPKVFFDGVFLKTHMNRRHPNEALDSEGVLSLTNKIQEYQRSVIGDNQSLDKLKDELKELTEKLIKTETNLIQEKEERIKLENRIDYVMKIRDKELQQSFREELEELKFVQRERHIEESVDTSDGKRGLESKNGISEMSPQKSRDVLKIEEMIEFQSKEMTRLGNNFQKLVSHLTESPDNAIDKPKIKLTAKPIEKTKPKQIERTVEVSQSMSEAADKSELGEIATTHPIANNRRTSKDSMRSPEKSETQVVKSSGQTQQVLDFEYIADDIKNSIDEKLISLGIDSNSSGITDKKYFDAMSRVSEERLLAIHQNRHDFDYQTIEYQIKSFVDKKVSEKSGQTITESVESITPKPKERRRSVDKSFVTEEQMQNPNQRSVEAIVHSSPIHENKVLDSTQDLDNDSDFEEDSEDEKPSEVVSVSPVVTPKSVLKPIINARKSDAIEPSKAQNRRIRFSEHRTEYQISPNESSEETSEESNEYPLSTDWKGSQSSADIQPIPAQRSHKIELTLDLKNSYTTDVSTGGTNNDIESMIDEIEDNITRGQTRGSISERQTKVQELTQMIEQQLNKRSAAQKKPPIGSVNVMTAQNKPFVPSSNLDSDDSD